MSNVKYAVVLDSESRQELERTVRAPTSEHRMVRRAEIILQSAAGQPREAIAADLHVSLPTVSYWRQRFCQAGVPGLRERSRSGRPPRIPEATMQAVVQRGLSGSEPASCRKVAQETGVSKATVQRIWSRNDIKPHLTRTFKLSNDPAFEDKFWDVIGLYMDPPENAVVLCCDEKTQCQALERTQPGLPLGMGHIRTRTHDYYRHGTITLFAALNYLTGRIVSRTEERHRHEEWLRFLKQVNREFDPSLDIHIILDNYATHKHANVRAWLAKHPRFHLHFTPTSASWMNLVERFFREISQDVIRRGSFTSVKQLVESILRYLASHNVAPKRYVWKADGQEILRKIARARQKLEQATGS
jgi:transposase